MSTQLELVRDFWSQTDCSASERNYYCFPPLRTRACQLIFGEQDASRPDWCEYWTIQKYFADRIPFGDCLSLCSGFGQVERSLAELGLAKRYLGVDIADGAIVWGGYKRRWDPAAKWWLETEDFIKEIT